MGQGNKTRTRLKAPLEVAPVIDRAARGIYSTVTRIISGPNEVHLRFRKYTVPRRLLAPRPESKGPGDHVVISTTRRPDNHCGGL